MSRKRYRCNLCEFNGSEDEFCAHFYQNHSRNNRCLDCPICGKKRVGTRSYGYSSHLHDYHGPSARRQKRITGKNFMFSLVVCQRKSDNKFLLVEECCQTGWWLPGGRVDPGETFQQAAIRETIEEAGCHVDLTGILFIENNAYFDVEKNKGNWKERVIFYARPKDENAELKSIPDYESIQAQWVEFGELMKSVESGKMKLRSFEPLKYFQHVIDHPDKIYPLDLLREKSHL